MIKEKLVPKLRFEEFENSNGWEKVELKDFLTKSVDNRGKTPPTTIEGDHPLIEVASIGKMTPDYSKVSKFMNEEIFKSKLRGYLKENDILFSTVGSIGTVSLMDDNKKAAIAQNIVGFRAKEGHVPEYIYSMLTSNYNQRRSNRIAMGAVQPSIKVSQLVNVKYPISIIKEEQSKIGTFFKKIDEMIQLQQSKVNKVKDIKSAYLSEMFPNEGEKYPKKRFEGFTKAWEFKNLETLTTTFTDGDWIESKDQSESGVRLIQTGNIGVTKFLDKPNNKKWISESTFKKLNCEEIFPGDILISRLPEPAGRATIVPKLNTRMITAVDCTIVRPSLEYSSDFLIQYLSTSNYFNKITSELAGGTRQRISRSNLAEIKIPVPKTLKEQEKIGQFFKNIDNQISIEEEKLTKLEKLKQAYLNDMFV